MIFQSRIPTSGSVALLALGVSLGAHFTGVLYGKAPERVEIAGGAGALALQGSSFQDFAAGVSTPVSAEPVKTPQPPTTQPVQPPIAPEPTITATMPPAAVTAPVASTVAVTGPLATTAPSVAQAEPNVASAPVTPQGALLSEPVTAEAFTSPVAKETDSPTLSMRPKTRPPEIMERAKAEQTARAQATPQPRGNAQADTRRGAATGVRTGTSTTQGSAIAQTAGNADVSNYPGRVSAAVARQPLPRARTRGVARVSFKIAGNGGLASVGLAKSSGNQDLDRAALNLIRRAAPFPPPPPGAQKQFVISIKSR
ncbi:energy transducer TonB [Roseobacter denitrificans]|uniref:Conserved domain protein n=1 Tax=Roseobacter denitrificans (strain ATCC 33942 / OCh 114) TaxID=375451 RepID=Q160F6_ROSDO|nr:TonB family protein [Roseobacter denitrificans]ABG33637.1 conserved domain protein [Roseobacter denitrificans OCh 114]AVL52933.1 energy transducer TonB [Roseobacter denitrificans]SFG03275.1 outer membrane transport energization protein TonB [Roseobacter denitrificans OCh 114]